MGPDKSRPIFALHRERRVLPNEGLFLPRRVGGSRFGRLVRHLAIREIHFETRYPPSPPSPTSSSIHRPPTYLFFMNRCPPPFFFSSFSSLLASATTLSSSISAYLSRHQIITPFFHLSTLSFDFARGVIRCERLMTVWFVRWALWKS